MKPTLSFCFNLPGRGRLQPADVETVRPLMQLVLYMVDRMKRCKLGKEVSGGWGGMGLDGWDGSVSGCTNRTTGPVSRYVEVLCYLQGLSISAK